MAFVKGQSGNPKGRPRTTDKYAGAIAKAEKQIADKLPSLIGNMLELAKGVFVEEQTLDGPRLVYQRPPDRQANEYLINRVMGKPTERQEVSGPDGAALFPDFDRALAKAYASDSPTD